METRKFDVIIIGFGKGGKTLAADMGKRGYKVAMVERSNKMYGGTCINIGCIPTKTLVNQAKLAACGGDKTFEEQRDFYRRAISIKENVTSTLRGKNYDNLANNPNITVFTGEASFVSADTVSVRTEAETFSLQAPQIFINTGAETIIPSIKGVEGNRFVFTSTSMLELNELPKRLLIVGGGYIGLEFASMFSSFGSQVTVLEGSDKLIAREDSDVAEAVKARLEKKGVSFYMNAKVQSIEQNEKEAIVTYQDAKTNEFVTFRAEAVLLATGRRPATSSLNLAAAGIQTDNRGAIIVDEHLVTTNPSVRALGDVKGGLQFTYVSLDDYRIVREDLFGEHTRTTSDRNPIVYSVFIDPPMARIGLNEDEANAKGLKFLVKKLPVAAIPRAKTLSETDGFLKALVEPDTQRILGCTLFCPEAREIINIVALVMKNNLPATVLRDFVFTHPSMSEALNDLFT